MRSYDVVMLVPLAEEFDTVKRVFDINRSFVRNRITFYELSVADPEFEGPDVDIVAVVLSQMGNANAAQKTERVLSMIDPPGPKLVTLVGIAGRLDDDLGLGDVVVGTEVTNYEIRSKLAEHTSEDTDGDNAEQSDNEIRQQDQVAADSVTASDTGLPLVNWEPGGRTYSAASEVFEAVARFRNETEQYATWRDETTQEIVNWVGSAVSRHQWPPSLGGPDRDSTDSCENSDQLTDDQFTLPLQAVNDPLASGSFVITSEEFTEKLATQNRNFAAVEMEAAGVLLTIQRTTGVNGLVIRGISDLADDGKGNLDGMGQNGGLWRRCATFAAANYLAHFIATGSLSEAESPADRPTVHQRQVPISEGVDQQTVDMPDISAADFQTTPSGPRQSYVRRYVSASQPTIKSDPPKDGVSVVAEFELCVPEPFQLSRISLHTEAIPDARIHQQDVRVDGITRPTTTGTEDYLEQPVTLSPEETATLRIATHASLTDPSEFGVERSESLPLELDCDFESPLSEETVQFGLSGYLNSTQGLEWVESRVDQYDT